MTSDFDKNFFGPCTERIVRITDISVPELDVYSRLSEPQLLHFHEPETGLFIAETSMVVERALDAGYEPISMLIDTDVLTKLTALISRCPDIPVYVGDSSVLASLTGFKLTRGILCCMRRRELPTLTAVCEGARRIVVLEDVMNPINVGSIFRSAAALGIDGVLLTSGCSDPLYRRALRVGMGTPFMVPWTYLPTGRADDAESESDASPADRRTLNSILHELGFRTVAMALTEASVRLDDPHIRAEERLAIVMGTEGDGLAHSTISECDYTVMIPMKHGVDSLNVAAASAVAFYELTR